MNLSIKGVLRLLFSGGSIGLDPDQYDIWHSSKTKEKEFNFISYSNPEVDELLEKGRRTFNIEERKKAYFRIQEILAEELPYLFYMCLMRLRLLMRGLKE